MWQMEVETSDGVWVPIRPAPLSQGMYQPPYRYEDRRDAEACLQRICMNIPPERKRVVRAVSEFDPPCECEGAIG